MMYEQLPQLINPVIVTIGGFALRWYGLMWIVAFGVVWMLLVWRLRAGEVHHLPMLTRDAVGDMMLFALIGGVVGGRIGYALFYGSGYFLQNPLALVWPFADGTFVGISGMSFHGGVIGVAVALWLFACKRNIAFLALMDVVVPAVPLGYAFGRIGNFLNHELWGRVTTSPLGMYFVQAPDGGTLLRHPSQLYEAFLEGLVLFCLLWFLRNRFTARQGFLTGVFLLGYSVARFSGEFFRAPDAHLGFVLVGLSMGQVLSVAMAIVGGIILGIALKKEV